LLWKAGKRERETEYSRPGYWSLNPLFVSHKTIKTSLLKKLIIRDWAPLSSLPDPERLG
jgi:hypothetical protein